MMMAQSGIFPKNETYEYLWGFEMQIDHSITTRSQDIALIEKNIKKERHVDIADLADHRMITKDSKEINKYLDLVRDVKNALKHKGNGDIIDSWRTRNRPSPTWLRNGWNRKSKEK